MTTVPLRWDRFDGPSPVMPRPSSPGPFSWRAPWTRIHASLRFPYDHGQDALTPSPAQWGSPYDARFGHMTMSTELAELADHIRDRCRNRGGAVICVDGGRGWSREASDSDRATSRESCAFQLALALNPDFQIADHIAWGDELSSLLDLLAGPMPPVVLVDDGDFMFSAQPGEELVSSLWSCPKMVILSISSIWKLPEAVARCVAYRVLVSKDGSKGRLEDSPYPALSREERLEHLGLAMFRRHERTGNRDALKKAMSSWRELVELSKHDTAEFGNRLANLAVALSMGFEVFDDPKLWEEALVAIRRSIELTPAGSSDRPSRLQNLGLCLAKQRTDRDLLMEGIRYLEEAAGTSFDDPVEAAHALSALSQGLMMLYEVEPEEAILKRVLTLRERALEKAPPETATHLAVAEELVMALLENFDAVRDATSLQRAETLLSSISRTMPRSSPEVQVHLANLSSLLSARYELTGQAEDLDRAVAMGEVTLKAAPKESQSRPLEMKNLATCLQNRYIDRGDPQDLEEALTLLRSAAALVPDSSAHYALIIGSLANALELEFERTGVIGRHEEALRLRQEALNHAAPRSSAMSISLANAANSLYEQFVRGGSTSDLSDGISLCKRALEQVPESSPQFMHILSNASSLLRERYLRTGDMLDLTTAEKMQRRACVLAASDPRSLPGMLTNLGIILKETHDKKGDPEILAEAIAILQQSVRSTPQHSTERPSRLNNLAAVLLERFRQDHNPFDLDYATEFLAEAIASSPPAMRIHLLSLGNLASALRQRSGMTKSHADLDQAIGYCKEALALLPSSSADVLSYQANLAGTFADRFLLSHEPLDQREACRLWREVADKSLDSAAVLCLQVADAWCRFAFERGDWTETTDAYARAQAAADRLSRAQLPVWRWAWVGELQGTSSMAAFSYAKQGRLSDAALALEGGRAKLVSSLMKRNFVEMSFLQRRRPDLHNRYVEIGLRMRQVASLSMKGEVPQAALTNVAAGRDLAGDLEEVIHRIREIPGLQTFHGPATLADLRATISGLPPNTVFVYLATTIRGSLALAVTPSGIEPVWLPVTVEELVSKLLAEGKERVSGYLAGQLHEPSLLRRALPGLLAWLGDALMGPIVQTLQRLGAKHVVLCVPGPMSLVPLHAAKYMIGGQEGYFLDEFDTAYAPSASAIAVATEELRERNSTLKLLGIADTEPQSGKLPQARSELDAVAALFQGDRRIVLMGGDATRDNVRGGMTDATHLHFACHGFYQIDDPPSSGLRLSNGESLTLRDLLTEKFSFPRARIAVLSACQSALTDFANLPDEFVGLPAGFLLAGVPAVVGTLWSVDDSSSALFMVRFYEILLTNRSGSPQEQCSPAEALRRTQTWMRTLDREALGQFLIEHPSLGRIRVPRGGHPFNHPAHWAPFLLVGA